MPAYKNLNGEFLFFPKNVERFRLHSFLRIPDSIASHDEHSYDNACRDIEVV